MKEVFAYIRVSTPRQGEQGVSLPEQRDAIEQYAKRNDLVVREWFEERLSAAKAGRPVFGRMLRELESRRVSGLILHKVDRSARNLRDWAEIGELIDRGVDVYFAHDGLDLRSRGGRLAADVEAVVAADYIRNLREETRKGFYGRLKQGLYPRPAPLGYLDAGAGKPKELDPVKGPLVRQMFELYATQRYGLRQLSAEMYRRGLRKKAGTRLHKNEVANLLHNPFYVGLCRIRKTGETFEGKHQPLIPLVLFERVQSILTGKAVRKAQTHDFLFRRLLRCSRCHRRLIGELQKGHVYYRCHKPSCRSTCIREEVIGETIRHLLMRLRFSDGEKQYLRRELEASKAGNERSQRDIRQGLALRQEQLDMRMQRLTDAFLDGLLDRPVFEERKTALLKERRDIASALTRASDETLIIVTLEQMLELADHAYLLYENGLVDEKRELLQTVMSNLAVDRKTPMFTMSPAFAEIARRTELHFGGPSRSRSRTAATRTIHHLLRQLRRLLASQSIRTIRIPFNRASSAA